MQTFECAKPDFCVKIVQWNLLAKWAATKDSFPMVDPECLQFESRIIQIKRIISSMDADIYSFQEVDFIEEIEELLKPQGYNIEVMTKASGSDSSVLAYKTSKLILSGIMKDRYVVDGKKCNQVYQIATFLTNSEDRIEFNFATTHLKAKAPFKDIRAAQISDLLSKLPSKSATIIAGDLNDTPSSPLFTVLSQHGYMGGGVAGSPDEAPSLLSSSTYKLRFPGDRIGGPLLGQPVVTSHLIDYILLPEDCATFSLLSSSVSFKSHGFDLDKGLPSVDVPSDHWPLCKVVALYKLGNI